MRQQPFKKLLRCTLILCSGFFIAAMGGCDQVADGNGNANGGNGQTNNNGSGDCTPMNCPFQAAAGQLAIVCVTPTPCSTDVSVNTDVVVQFNRAVNLDRVSGDLLSETGDSAELRVDLSGDRMTLTVHFEGGLQDNVTYGMAVLEARDDQDNPLSNPGVFCFSTGSSLNCPTLPTCAAFDATDAGVPAFTDYSYTPPYAADSVWNTPIPDNPAIASESTQYINRFAETYAAFGGMFLSVAQDAVPVYLADATTPQVSVSVTSGFAASPVINAPIPDHAVPDCGLDRFMSVFDQAQGLYYEFWRTTRDDTGSWQAALASSSDINGTGVFPARGPNDTDAVRASGFALWAGMVWPHELQAGQINHALVFVYPLTRADQFVAPATATDGVSTETGALPMGSLLQLDPTLNLDTLNLDPWEETIARALQEYGMYCGDTGGGISLSGLHVLSFQGNPYQGLLPDSVLAESGVLLSKLPADRFRVLSPPVN